MMENNADQYKKATFLTNRIISLMLFKILLLAVSFSVLADTGDIPAEKVYRGFSVKYFSTPTEACASNVIGWSNPSYTNPQGFENYPGYGLGCQYTLVYSSGYTTTVFYQNWFSKATFCPSGYDSISNIACRYLNPVASPKYPVANLCNATGNPILTAYGNKIQREVDYTGIDGSLLKLERIYNSTPPLDLQRLKYDAYTLGALGVSWLHNYSRLLKVVSNGTLTVLYVYRPDGRFFIFRPNASGWTTDADINDSVSELKDPSTHATIGWQYTDGAADEIETYDASGVLVSLKTRSGETLSFAYSDASTPSSIARSAGELIRVTDAFGRQLNFTYDDNGRINTVTDPAGHITRYSYDASGNLATVTYPDNTPADVTDNPKKTYLYGEKVNTGNLNYVNLPYALTGIVDENGVRYATYKYGVTSTPRAISTEHAGGIEKYSLALSTNGSSTGVTDPLGTLRTYRFANILGTLKSTGSDQPAGSGCGASSSSIGYDANGNVAYRIDFNGHRTNYTYDLTRNLETRRTEGLTAAGATTPETRTITTGWHPTFRLPVKITEPGLETTYSYNDKGEVTLKSLKDLATQQMRTWITAYTYSAAGSLLSRSEDGPRTDVTDVTVTDYYPPDADCVGGHFGCRGQLQQITRPGNQTTRITRYSANGQPEEVIDPNGLVTTLAYDVRQRLVSQDIGGEVTTYSYDPTGLVSHVAWPGGASLDYRYDDAHRLVEVEDQASNKVTYTLDPLGHRTQEAIRDPSGQLARSQSRVYDALSRLQHLIQTP